ncbi:aldehyde dehydrogenase family protein [Variovorax sp. KK3]|uniref:aldehyde dehydrogenase family protein n=1 Tax=Variovorax sp. KK3 TaxID=1855728 RepID=UPI00097C54E3|nr:aldehyde dehydrogenase family protein [Variovorax sp. KK3]
MIIVRRAFDRASIAELPEDDAASLQRKLALAARLHADRSQWLPPHERMGILRRLVPLLEGKRVHLARQISLEGGKPLVDALVEVDRAVDGVRNAVDVMRTEGGHEIPMGLTAASADRRAFTFHEPIGVVVAISAFNHPLNLIVHQVVPAVAVGCPVIVKPAPATPLSCLELADLLEQAGLPEGWCQVFLSSDTALAEALATDRRVAFLSFIGSARVGWHLRSKLPPGTRCALEHGGAAPCIVDRSADLGRLLEPLAKGSYYHAGQVCVSTQRIFVHRSLRDDFLERFAARVLALRTGDPALEETELGPLISPEEATRVEQWIGEAVASGATLVGGGRLSPTTLRPSILVEPPPDAKVSSLEVFGPTTCVHAFDDLGQAIAAANGLPTAFQASIFTNDLNAALHAAERLDASAVMVNDHTAFRTDWMPFAGRRESGYGTGGIPWTMRDMSSRKMVVFRTGWQSACMRDDAR